MKSVDRSPADIVDLAKLAEGGLYLPHHYARRLPNGSAFPVPGFGPQVLLCR